MMARSVTPPKHSFIGETPEQMRDANQKEGLFHEPDFVGPLDYKCLHHGAHTVLLFARVSL
jgi:hypothetical protein